MPDQALSPAFLTATSPQAGQFDQTMMLLVGRMDAKIDLLLLADGKQDIEIDKLNSRLVTIESNQQTNRTIMKILGSIWGAGIAILGLVLSHFWK